MKKSVNILGVYIDKLTLNSALDRIFHTIETKTSNDGNIETALVITANPEIVMLAQQDETFKNIVSRAELVTADGIGIVLGAKILGKELPERVTGIDLTVKVLEEASKKGYGVYLLGAKPGVAEKAALHLLTEHVGLNIVGWQHGYFEDSEAIVADINEKAPKILLVALGMGKQEKWIWDNRHKLNVPVAIGVGGSFDVFAGEIKRAPVWMQKAGLEWLYRLASQPSRAKRMTVLPKFLLRVFQQGLKGNKKQ